MTTDDPEFVEEVNSYVSTVGNPSLPIVIFSEDNPAYEPAENEDQSSDSSHHRG